MSEAPNTIHGYVVLQAQATRADGIARAGHVILVDKGEGYHRWVTAWLGEGDGEWAWGHYFRQEADARSDYAFRCKRGY